MWLWRRRGRSRQSCPSKTWRAGKQLGSLHKNDYKVPGLYSERRCVGDQHVSDASLTSDMTTTEQDNDTSTRNHAKHELALRWLTIQLRWVITRVDPGQHPRYTRVGGSTAVSNHNLFIMVAERQCCLLSSKGVQPACATVPVPVVTRRVKASPRLKHTAKPLRIHSVHQCRNVDDYRMHTCGPRGTCVDGVSSYSGEYDPGFRETDIDGDKLCENFDDCAACSIGSCKPISKMLQGAVFSSERGERSRSLDAHFRHTMHD